MGGGAGVRGGGNGEGKRDRRFIGNTVEEGAEMVSD